MPPAPARPSVRSELRELLAADFARNPFLPARVTLLVLRSGQVLHGRRDPLSFVGRRFVQLARSVWLEGIMGSEIPSMVRSGPGLRLPHAGRGIMIHPSVTIGSGVTLYHQTVLGVRDDGDGPRVQDDVEIGAGAKILGPILVARGCRIGANAVLVRDTEPDGTYVGVPARRVVSGR